MREEVKSKNYYFHNPYSIQTIQTIKRPMLRCPPSNATSQLDYYSKHRPLIVYERFLHPYSYFNRIQTPFPHHIHRHQTTLLTSPLTLDIK